MSWKLQFFVYFYVIIQKLSLDIDKFTGDEPTLWTFPQENEEKKTSIKNNKRQRITQCCDSVMDVSYLLKSFPIIETQHHRHTSWNNHNLWRNNIKTQFAWCYRTDEGQRTRTSPHNPSHLIRCKVNFVKSLYD
jgi:hypothetical protein